MELKRSKTKVVTEVVNIAMTHKEVHDLIKSSLLEWAKKEINQDIGELKLEFYNEEAEYDLSLDAIFTKTTETTE